MTTDEQWLTQSLDLLTDTHSVEFKFLKCHVPRGSCSCSALEIPLTWGSVPINAFCNKCLFHV